MATLSADAVNAIAKKALFNDDEIIDGKPSADAIMVDGILHKFAFHRERTMAAKPEIDALLAELPDHFQQEGGGGWTFLNACVDKENHQWGEQRDVEMLVCLGIAVGSASWQMKEFMEVLPGGMPYFEVHGGVA